MFPRALAIPLLALLASCGRISVPEDPADSCNSRDCREVRALAPRGLSCAAHDLLVRDEGAKRFRATGCGRTQRFDCERGCRPVGEARAIGLEREATYRAAFVLRCEPGEVEIAGALPALSASCRGVDVALLCDEERGCKLRPAEESFARVMRRIEPDALGCARRSEAELMVRVDSRGEIVEVSMDGMRAVRPRRDATRSSAPSGRIECFANLFKRLPRLADAAGETTRVHFGGSGYRAPRHVFFDEEDTTPFEAAPPETDDSVADAPPSIRARLDVERDSILACTQTAEALVVARWNERGEVTLSLTGALEGSPGEGCMRAAIGPLQVEAEAAGELHHLVRRLE